MNNDDNNNNESYLLLLYILSRVTSLECNYSFEIILRIIWLIC